MFDRRSALKGLGAAVTVAPLSGLSASPRQSSKPTRLRAGDTVGLVAPAGFVADRFGLEKILETVRAMGLVPKAGTHLLDRYGYLAGTDEERAAELNAMFADGEVAAIFAVRGGWGSARILPFLDYRLIRANPKLLVGSSDVTALHLAFASQSCWPGIHGPNIVHSWTEATWNSFRRLAFDADTPTYHAAAAPNDGRLSTDDSGVRTFRPGLARGRLLGGNLSVLSAMIGTPYLPDFTGSILFLEEVNEAQYRIDRMLTQLGQSGALADVAGVVFGQCTNCRNPGDPYGNFTVYEVLDHHLTKLGVPTFQGASIGHIADQQSIPVGIEAEIDAAAGTIRILESAVA